MSARLHVDGQVAADGVEQLRVTPRQAEILDMITCGDSNKHIARRLGLSERTVKTHLERLFFTHGFHSRAEAAAAWARSGNGVGRPSE